MVVAGVPALGARIPNLLELDIDNRGLVGNNVDRALHGWRRQATHREHARLPGGKCHFNRAVGVEVR